MESAMSEGTGAEGDGGDANATDKENLEPAKGDNDMDVDGNSLLYCIIHLPSLECLYKLTMLNCTRCSKISLQVNMTGEVLVCCFELGLGYLFCSSSTAG